MKTILIIMLLIVSQNCDFAQNKSKDLIKDVKDFGKSVYEATKEGYKVLNENPNKNADKLMNDAEYQKNLENKVDNLNNSAERINRRVNNTSSNLNNNNENYGASTSYSANFKSIYDAERFIIGSWKSIGSSNENGGLEISRDYIGSKITFYNNGTYKKTLGKMYDNQVIEGTWQVKPDEYANYYLEEKQGAGLFVIIVKYTFEGRDYLVNSCGVKFRRY